jgi:hypothetical protein
MSTVSDHLDSILALAHDAQIRPCMCEGGRVVDYDMPSVRIDAGPDRFAWSYATKPCDQCDGTGAVQPRDSAELYSVGIVSALGFAVQMRDAELYGAMNEALDWGAAKYLELLALTEASSGISLADAMDNLLADAARGRNLVPPLPTAAPTPGSGALTEDELAELLGGEA